MEAIHVRTTGRGKKISENTNPKEKDVFRLLKAVDRRPSTVDDV
jgi:hypothetical protein